MFFPISMIFRDLLANGNCKLYVMSKPPFKVCKTFSFKIIADGRLIITSEVEEHAYPITREVLTSKEPRVCCKYGTEECSIERYPEIVAYLIDASLSQSKEYYLESDILVEQPANAEIALNELYQILKPFLEMEEKELGLFVQSAYDHSSIMNYLINKDRNNSSHKLISSKYIDFTVEAEFAEFYAKFKKARLAWYKVQIASSEEEFSQASAEWDRLYVNPTMSSQQSASPKPTGR